MHWHDFCKYQPLHRFLDTSTHQTQNTGLRTRALNSTPQPAVERGSQLCIRLNFSYQTIPVCIQVPSGHRALAQSTLDGEKMSRSNIPSSPSTRKTKTDALNINIYWAANKATEYKQVTAHHAPACPLITCRQHTLMKHLGLNAFSDRSNGCSRVGRQSKADPCLEAEALGLNKNKQRNHIVHLAVGKILRRKTPFKTRKESQEQQKVNSSQKRR